MSVFNYRKASEVFNNKWCSYPFRIITYDPKHGSNNVKIRLIKPKYKIKIIK